MNEREYLTIEYFSLILGVIYISICIFLTSIFNITGLLGFFLFFSVFFFIITIYSHYKRQKYVLEMLEEINKHRGDR